MQCHIECPEVYDIQGAIKALEVPITLTVKNSSRIFASSNADEISLGVVSLVRLLEEGWYINENGGGLRLSKGPRGSIHWNTIRGFLHKTISGYWVVIWNGKRVDYYGSPWDAINKSLE